MKIVITNKNFSNISFEEKIQNLKKLISNDISSWKAFSDKYQFKTIYILQPGIKWVDKKLTKKEIFIYENQRVHLDFCDLIVQLFFAYTNFF